VKNNLLIAVLLTLSGLFFLDCMGIAIKYLRNDYPAAVLSVYRNLFGIIPCMLVLFLSSQWHAGGRKIIIKEWRLGLLRGVFVCFAQICLYTSYFYVPYALVATMEHTGPMIVSLLCIPILGEKFGLYKMSAVILGFVGIIFIMQPWTDDFNIYLILPICAAFGYSLARVTSLSFPKEVLSPLINIYAQVGTILCSSLIIIFFNQWTPFKSIEDLLLILIMGLIGGTGTLLIIYGARKAELSKITPFDYIEIFFALILGWVFFQEWPIDSLFPGVLFIIAGGLIIIWRQKKRNFLKERKA
jgi:drug/metabolite transporter (DMT)-like permease